MTRTDPSTLLASVLAAGLAFLSALALLPLGLSEAGAGLVAADDLVLKGGEEVRVAYRAPSPRRESPVGRPLAGGAVIGQDAAGVTAMLGQPSGERAAGSGKVLRYERPGCIVEVHLFANARRDGLTALDVIGTGACQG